MRQVWFIQSLEKESLAGIPGGEVLLELLLGSGAVPAAIHRRNQWSGRKSEITADKPAAATEICGVGDGAGDGAAMQSNPHRLVNHLNKAHLKCSAWRNRECWQMSWEVPG